MSLIRKIIPGRKSITIASMSLDIALKSGIPDGIQYSGGSEKFVKKFGKSGGDKIWYNADKTTEGKY